MSNSENYQSQIDALREAIQRHSAALTRLELRIEISKLRTAINELEARVEAGARRGVTKGKRK